VFPDEALVPETQLHLELRTILYQLLRDFLGDSVTVACDQFVYWVADDPSEVLAPDACVRRAPADGLLKSWKTWERGAPEVAVEIVSESDSSEAAWRDKLGRYRRVGVSELVRFDASASPPGRLRVWDRLDGDLVEREVEGEAALSTVLPCAWVVAPADDLPVALRLRSAGADAALVATRAEARRQEAEARRQERAEAGARVAALEAELARLRGAEDPPSGS
jgi:Uma2 family endonuclease